MRPGEYDGVSASGDSSVRLIDAGLVAPGQHVDLITNYSDLSPFLKDQHLQHRATAMHYGIPHGWGANLLMWQHRRRDAGARLVGRRVRPGLAVQGQGHGLRRADLHRRRRAVPDEDPAGPRHQGPVLARPEAVRRRRRAAEAAAARSSASTGATTPRPSRRVRAGLDRARHDLAGHRQPGRRRRGATVADGPARRRARPGGPTPGWSRPRPSTPTACTCGWTTSPGPTCRPRWRTTSARPRPTPRRAT